ncbi:hypothetical protein MNBD_GAMMA04-920 [hydrothermal vent metagenome]|uniref:BPL/LPL catalytic domain-containing protein n=1 Tax=hydrothermal vent metagenome TaxID=652676 RepID=A0A3B0VRF1_9ZZZZ
MNFSKMESLFKKEGLNYQFVGLESIDSTSAYLKRQANKKLQPMFCIATSQVDGYGQRQRQWLSNEDSLAFSVLCRFSVPIHELEGVSQIVGLKLIESLVDVFNDQLFIKWPNDLYSDSGKVAGLLIECVAFDKDACWLVIGVGINCSSMDASSTVIKKSGYPISHLKLPKGEDNTVFLTFFVAKLDELSHSFVSGDFEKHSESYQKYDYFDLDQPVIVYDTEQSISGCYKGLTQRGELLFESEGCRVTYRSGDVSIRTIDDI